MRALVLFTLVVAARAFYPAPMLGARFSYGTRSLAPLYGGLGYSAGLAAPAATVTQSHAQDELGQYKFGYASHNSARKEVKTADGVVRGSYSYVDSFGIPQKVNYVADALGFRVAATNLPVAPIRRRRSLALGAPLAMGMRAAPLAMGMRAAPLAMGMRAAPLAMGMRAAPFAMGMHAYAPAKRFGYSFTSVNPLIAPKAMLAPMPMMARRAMMAPMPMMAPMAMRSAMALPMPAAASKQHHVQDEWGQYDYGYASPNSAKKEMKTADGVVRGSYSYVDSFGIPQKVKYVADALGFRVAATNLPVAPAAAPMATRAW